MKNFIHTLFVAVAFVCVSLVFGSSSAQAQAQRTFVSTSGDDANTATNCGRLTPCRGFAAAISVVSPNGEVVALDSGGYGPITITKPVQLISPTGVYAAITAFAGTAITINVGSSDAVVLRGLTLNGLGAQFGVAFQTGRILHVESCVLNGFSSAGINVNREMGNDTAEVLVKDTIVRNGANNGIFLRNGGSNGIVRASIDNSRFERNNNAGLMAQENTRVTVRGSVAANNVSGFAAVSQTVGQTAQLNLESCVATNNGTFGILTGGTGAVTVRVSNSTVTNNSTGIKVGDSSTVLSRGNNTVHGNSSANVDGSLTALPGI